MPQRCIGFPHVLARVFRVVMCVAFLSWAAIALPVHAAGPRTHAQMGYRALERYLDESDAMLPGLKAFFADEKTRAAFYSGCAFPDWGFSNVYHDAGEHSHWLAFHNAYEAYLRRTFPQPWDAPARREVAFFLGAISHGITDVPWHFNHAQPPHRSLLAMSLAQDQADHATTEILGDLFIHANTSLDIEMAGRFHWPYQSILAAFHASGYGDVTLEHLKRGTHILETGWTAGALVGAGAAHGFAEKYPWLTSHLHDYYYGGVEHGGAATIVWLRYYYARLSDVYLFQQTPDYSAPSPFYTYRGCRDATVIEARPDHNTGGEPLLEIGHDADGLRSAALAFDLSAISPNTTVHRAILWLHIHDHRGERPAGKFELRIRPLLGGWQEGDGQTDVVNGSAGKPRTDQSLTWKTLPRTGEAVATVNIERTENTGQWVQIDVTAAVQAWVNDPATNHGMLIEGTAADGSSGVLRIISSDAMLDQADGYCGGTRIAYRPLLIVVPRLQ